MKKKLLVLIGVLLIIGSVGCSKDGDPEIIPTEEEDEYGYVSKALHLFEYGMVGNVFCHLVARGRKEVFGEREGVEPVDMLRPSDQFGALTRRNAYTGQTKVLRTVYLIACGLQQFAVDHPLDGVVLRFVDINEPDEVSIPGDVHERFAFHSFPRIDRPVGEDILGTTIAPDACA